MDRWNRLREEAADDEAPPFHLEPVRRALLLGILGAHQAEEDPIRWFLAVERDMKRLGLWPLARSSSPP